MAIFSYRIGDRVSRGAGQSAVKVAAYQAREKLTDARTACAYNYQPREKAPPAKNSGITAAAAYIDRESEYQEGRMPALFVGLYAPKDAPAWCRGSDNIEQFWSRAELAERRQDAQIAERIIVALPHELSLKQNIWLLQDHVKEFTRQGRVVQVAIHAPEHGDGRNIHAHLLVSMRGVDEHGFKASKAETKYRYMHRREYVTNLRERWTEAVNHHLDRHGFASRIDHRTLADQGIDRAPTIHLGPGDSRRERHGERSAAGEVNRVVSATNAARSERTTDIPAIDRAVAQRETERAKTPGVSAGRDAATKPSASSARRRTSPSDNANPYWQKLRHRAAAEQPPEAGNASALSKGSRDTPSSSARPQTTRPTASNRTVAELSQRAQLHRASVADRVPSGWRDLTVTDVARELSPAYADQLKVIKNLQEEIGKTDRAADHRRRERVDHNEQRKKRWQSLGWLKKTLHVVGVWRDREIKNHDEAEQRASRGFDRMRIRHWARTGALATAERQAATEFEKIKPLAETELAKRQKIAAEARGALAKMTPETIDESTKTALEPERIQRRGFRLRP
jgi:hypothetical protein